MNSKTEELFRVVKELGQSVWGGGEAKLELFMQKMGKRFIQKRHLCIQLLIP